MKTAHLSRARVKFLTRCTTGLFALGGACGVSACGAAPGDGGSAPYPGAAPSQVSTLKAQAIVSIGSGPLTIGGSVLGPNGAPISGATVQLQGSNLSGSALSVTGSDGTWAFAGVSNGSYSVQALQANCNFGATRLLNNITTNQTQTFQGVSTSTGTCGSTPPAGGQQLITTVALAVGSPRCPTGGSEFDIGGDTNGNGKLDANEITSRALACNGAAGAKGATGANGLTSLLLTSPIAPGSQCPSGGTKIDSGLDTNGDGMLEQSEVTSTAFVCNASGDGGATCTPSPSAKLVGCNFAEADLRGVDLSGSDLTGANLTAADLTGANLSGTDFTGANLTGANLTDANLTINQAILKATTLTGANLTNARLVRLTMIGINALGANMTGALLEDDDLSSADLVDLDLSDADIAGTNLSEAQLFRANLTNAFLIDADLTGASLAATILSGTQFERVIFKGTVCPDGSDTDTGC